MNPNFTEHLVHQHQSRLRADARQRGLVRIARRSRRSGRRDVTARQVW